MNPIVVILDHTIRSRGALCLGHSSLYIGVNDRTAIPVETIVTTLDDRLKNIGSENGNAFATIVSYAAINDAV